MAKLTLSIEGDTAADGDLLKAIGEASAVSLSAMTHDSSKWTDRMIEVTLQEMRTKRKDEAKSPEEPPKPEPPKPEAVKAP